MLSDLSWSRLVLMNGRPYNTLQKVTYDGDTSPVVQERVFTLPIHQRNTKNLKWQVIFHTLYRWCRWCGRVTILPSTIEGLMFNPKENLLDQQLAVSGLEMNILVFLQVFQLLPPLLAVIVHPTKRKTTNGRSKMLLTTWAAKNRLQD